MRVLISVDMEGVAGVVDRQDISPGDPEWSRNRRLMTNEASAAVRGVLAAEPDAEVIVSDAHAVFRNLLPEELDPRARLFRGRPRPFGMMTGIDEGVDRTIFIGYHGREGTARSILSHTISGAVIRDVRINGDSLGEIGLNAALTVRHGAVPVLASGDDTVAAEIADLLPGMRAVTVKQARGWASGLSAHPDVACARIEAATAEALTATVDTSQVDFPGPVTLEVDTFRPAQTELAALIPGVTRPGPATLRFAAESYTDAYNLVYLVAQLGQP